MWFEEACIYLFCFPFGIYVALTNKVNWKKKSGSNIDNSVMFPSIDKLKNDLRKLPIGPWYRQRSYYDKWNIGCASGGGKFCEFSKFFFYYYYHCFTNININFQLASPDSDYSIQRTVGYVTVGGGVPGWTETVAPEKMNNRVIYLVYNSANSEVLGIGVDNIASDGKQRAELWAGHVSNYNNKFGHILTFKDTRRKFFVLCVRTPKSSG